MMRIGTVFAAAGVAFATPAAADPWVYLGNYADGDGTNPLLIDEGSITTADGVTRAVARINVAYPDSEFAELAIAQYPLEMDCNARTFRFARYDYLRADGTDTGIGERFLGSLNATTPLKPERLIDRRLFDYACKIDRRDAKKLGKYDYAAIKARFGGEAPPPADDEEEWDW